MLIDFEKFHGAGNDFIFIDNRSGKVPADKKAELVTTACHRRFGVGADGVMFIESDPELDFSWDFYNSDASRGEMCGNGSRCAAVFAHMIGAAGKKMTFRTLAGPIEAELTDRGARVRLTDCTLPGPAATLTVDGANREFWFLNTGVPHAILPESNLDTLDIKRIGALIRYHPHFAPAGTNVNFIQKIDASHLNIRTYERGVEDETWACGTGSTAAAIAACQYLGCTCPVVVRTKGGELVIQYSIQNGKAVNVLMEGPAVHVFSGKLEI